MVKKTEFDYQKASSELEKILDDLQDSDIDIAAATKLHAKGLTLIEQLETYLKQAEVEISKHLAE
jgi:exodeoxyribonuclease VII small subunit